MAKVFVKNWLDFQHYKDRSPPWIKLHKTLLDNYEFQSLQIASKALAPMFWLLASENMDGSFEDDLVKLEFRLRTPKKVVGEALTELIHKGFFVRDSESLADCKQVAMPEKSRDRVNSAVSRPDDISESIWNDFLKLIDKKKSPLTQTALTGIEREAAKAGVTLEAALQTCCERGWQGFKADWVAGQPNGQPAWAGAL